MIKENIIFKSSNVNYVAWLFFTFFLLYLLIMSILNGVYLVSIFSILMLLIFIYFIIKKENVIFYENYFNQISFFTKKTIRTCSYQDIEKIYIDYYLDTKMRGKLLRIFTKQGIEIKLNFEWVLVEDISKIFINKNIPLYIKKNGKYVQIK